MTSSGERRLDGEIVLIRRVVMDTLRTRRVAIVLGTDEPSSKTPCNKAALS
jgi:hypothetical protein